MLRFSRVVFLLTLVCLNVPKIAAAQAVKPTAESQSSDAQISRAVKEISAEKIQQTINHLVGFHTRLTVSTNLPVESGRGVLAAAAWIQQQLESYSKDCGGCLQVKTFKFTQQPTPRIPQPTEITDVYAVLPGTDPANAKRIYVITGHYDSIALAKMTDPEAEAPGANDDGSGTATVLETARVLSKYKFPATIIFCAVAGEEQGLNGSAGFAKMAKAEGWDIEADLNNDIVGGDKNPGQRPTVVRVFSEGIPMTALGNADLVKEVRLTGMESDSASRELARYVNSIGLAYQKDGAATPHLVFRQDRYLRGGDHTSFNEQGFAAVRLTEWRENYDHQHQVVRTENGIEYGDLPKFVNFDYVARVAKLNLATLASLASAPAPPQQVRIDATKLENGTTLKWQPSPGELAASYEVVWRDTTSAEWENFINAGNVTTTTVDESKDNVIFGVRAVDKAGHRSVVVVPTREARH
jgi:Peptidase family M28